MASILTALPGYAGGPIRMFNGELTASYIGYLIQASTVQLAVFDIGLDQTSRAIEHAKAEQAASTAGEESTPGYASVPDPIVDAAGVERMAHSKDFTADYIGRLIEQQGLTTTYNIIDNDQKGRTGEHEMAQYTGPSTTERLHALPYIAPTMVHFMVDDEENSYELVHGVVTMVETPAIDEDSGTGLSELDFGSDSDEDMSEEEEYTDEEGDGDGSQEGSLDKEMTDVDVEEGEEEEFSEHPTVEDDPTCNGSETGTYSRKRKHPHDE